MIIKELNIKQIRQTKKLAIFNFIIKYYKNKLNSINASLRRSNIIKSNNNKNNNNDFLSILRNKLRNQKY